MESDVARWHRLSGLPDNVTDDGQVVSQDPGRREQAEKASLRAAIAHIRDERAADGHPADSHPSEEARNLARLAASYLLAGDVETARRYVERASSL